jgi:hypothetical protein
MFSYRYNHHWIEKEPQKGRPVPEVGEAFLWLKAKS